MTAAVALAGIGGVLGIAIYAIIITRRNGDLRVELQTAEHGLAGANGKLTAAQRDLRAHKKIIEQLEADGGPCVVDENFLARLPPGSIRDLIDRELRANEDGVRSGSIGGDGLERFAEDSEAAGLVEQPLR